MDRRENNVRIFNDTLDLIDSSDELMDIIDDTIENQKLILSNDKLVLTKEKRDCLAKVIVSEKRTLEAAGAYKDRTVCILNFASATNPGGGVERGASAQEESICRCSTLYDALCVKDLYKSFYKPHRVKGDPLYNDDIIYSPKVCVVKSDTASPERLPADKRYFVNVITCAAPNLRRLAEINASKQTLSTEKLESILTRRIDRIFAIAVNEGNEILILGAFGCGAFRNPPEVVAKAFRKVMDKYLDFFETVEFAVYHTKKDTRNYDAFYNEFRSSGKGREGAQGILQIQTQ